MRALVTGATGFVGRHTLAPLASRGYEVHLTSREPPDDELSSAAGGLAWHGVDLLQAGEPARVVGQVRPTHLLHLAWYTEPGVYWSSPENTKWVDASLAMLKAFAEIGGRRVVIAGTCAEYDPTDGPCVEMTTPIRPTTRYAAAKHDLHVAGSAYAGEAGIELLWARLFFLYGPHEHPSRLVPSIARALLLGEPAATTDGRQVRDFLNVEDAGNALAALLATHVEGPVNVASGDPIEVRKLAELTAQAVGRPDLLRLGELPRPPDDPDLIAADVARLRDEIGWRPATSLEQGVARTVAWWRDRTR